jgi:hypothetical protein
MGVGEAFELVSRVDCHLCDEMEQIVRPILAAYGLELGYRDVDAEPELLERFGDLVPVLLRDGRPVAKIRLTTAQADRLIRRRL